MNDSVLSVLEPQVKDLGGFTIQRVLPGQPHKMVGPFIFFDYIGPAQFDAGQGIDVRPHPHIGLATVTYLFDGAILHRDSLGSVQTIEPGDVNWMTAGSGIVHSERTPEALRAAGSRLHGFQIWVALPKAHESTAPRFEHHPAETLPVIKQPGVTLRVIAGTVFGQTAPATTFSPMCYAVADIDAGHSLVFAPEYEERAVFAVEGNVELDGAPLELHHMGVLQPGRQVVVEARTPSRVVLLGGEPMDGDRIIWWNFVASSTEAIDQAKARWRDRQFGTVPGDTERIPLPDEPKPAEPMS